jgi:hypothetical protein
VLAGRFRCPRDAYYEAMYPEVPDLIAPDNGMFDASIAAWDTKRYWDSERREAAIRTLARIFQGCMFHEDWQPYLPTPPFSEFVSSHSALSASAADCVSACTIPCPQTGQWLQSIVQGYFNYYAVPGNLTSLGRAPQSGACSLVAYHSPTEPETPDQLDAHSRVGTAMAPSTACAPPLS